MTYFLQFIESCLVKKHHVSFSKEKKIVKAYGYWYMTSDGIWIKISHSTKASHWFLDFVLDTLSLQEIAYQIYLNGVASSLHKAKKSLWPPFPLSMGVHRIESFK